MDKHKDPRDTGSDLNRSEKETTRRPSEAFEGSTGGVSGDQSDREHSSEVERERMSGQDRNVEH